jgi:hypothetical protein
VIASTAALAAAALPGAIAGDPGERMEFAVRYMGAPVGRARLSVGEPEGPILPIFLEARTSGLASAVRLRQQLASHVERATGLPQRASLDATEGRYRHVDTTRFDRASGKASVRVQGRSDHTYELEVPKETVDFVALVFRLRSLPLDPGDRHEFHVLTGRRLSRVVTEVEGRETVSTRAGEFAAIKVKVPTGLSGKFSERNPTCAWFSDDARRIVVRITTDFAVGHATAGLVAYDPGRPAG